MGQYSGHTTLFRDVFIDNVMRVPNYTDYPRPSCQYNPLQFDKDWAEERLPAALASPTSLPSGAKRFHIPYKPLEEWPAETLKDGHRLQDDWVPLDEKGDGGGFWRETQSTGKDKRRHGAICALCGKPDKDLMACSGCRQQWCVVAVR